MVDHQPLLTTLDVNMPGIDGFEAARRIRRQSDTYIIMLTGLEEEADVVLGLGAGADEYVVKPFRRANCAPGSKRSFVDPRRRVRRCRLRPEREGAGLALPATHTAVGAPVATEAAVDARPRVDEDLAPSDGWLAHRDLHLDPESRLVRMAGEELDLTARSSTFSPRSWSPGGACAARRISPRAAGRVVRHELLRRRRDKRAIEAHMTNLRRKLGDNPANPRYIENRSRGRVPDDVGVLRVLMALRRTDASALSGAEASAPPTVRAVEGGRSSDSPPVSTTNERGRRHHLLCGGDRPWAAALHCGGSTARRVRPASIVRARSAQGSPMSLDGTSLA